LTDNIYTSSILFYVGVFFFVCFYVCYYIIKEQHLWRLYSIEWF